MSNAATNFNTYYVGQVHCCHHKETKPEKYHAAITEVYVARELKSTEMQQIIIKKGKIKYKKGTIVYDKVDHTWIEISACSAGTR